MLIGVGPQQLVELGLLRGDSRIDFRGRDRCRGPGPLGQQRRRLAGKFALVRIPRLLGPPQFEPRAGDVVSQLRHLGEEVLADLPALARHAHVLELEFLEPRFRQLQALLIPLDLLVEELDGAARILPLVVEAGFDKDGEHGLDDVLCLLRLRVPIGNDVDVVRDVAGELDRPHQVVDQVVALGVGLDAEIEVRHANQLLDIGPADQRPAHQRDLLVEIRLDGESRHDRPQQRLRVDIDASARLEFFRNAIHDGDADYRGDPGGRQPDPAAVPHGAQVRNRALKEFIHMQCNPRLWRSRPARRAG